MAKEDKYDVVSKEEKEADARDTWTGKLDFLMSALSFAVGMGNIWRFPYICYRNGGGAFLIPYITMVLLAGFPLIYLEFSFGQYGAQGVVSIWKACPLFQGIGWTMFCISFFSCMYYNMLVAYSFFYTFASFAKTVPWLECGNIWNSPGCHNLFQSTEQINCTSNNGTWANSTCLSAGSVVYNVINENTTNITIETPKSPADEYFHRYMLGISEGIDDLGMPRWNLALCLLLCWIIVFICLSRGIKSSGKATYITSTFPFVILFILFIRGITLDGAGEGIMYYITPQWHRLASAKVWGDAAVQVFFSMSICWGGLITLASYNKKDNNCFRDSVVVAVGDFLTSIFAGFVIFAIIGYLAKQMGVPIDEVATDGAGLAFIIYPSAVARLPISPLWAILFMLVLINLGIGTQFTLVTTAHTTLLDAFSDVLRKGRRPLALLFAICTFCFLLGLVFTTNGGMYVLQLMDSYAPSYALLTVGLSETLVLSWVYGYDRLAKNMEEMFGNKPSKVWMVLWKYITPVVIVSILLFTFIDFKPSSYGSYKYPLYADVIGWCIALAEISCIPGVAIYKLLTTYPELTLKQRLYKLTRPADDWGKREDSDEWLGKELQEVKVPLKTEPVV